MKTERIYLRANPDDKHFLREIADTKYKGNLSSLFEEMVKDLREREDHHGCREKRGQE